MKPDEKWPVYGGTELRTGFINMHERIACLEYHLSLLLNTLPSGRRKIEVLKKLTGDDAYDDVEY